jgi:hypothetical protein
MGATFALCVLLSANVADWGRVEQLAPTAEIEVATDSGVSYRGRFVGADSVSLQLVETAGHLVALDRAGVQRVSKNLGTHHKRRNVVVGFLAGGLVGALIHQAGCPEQGPACSESGILGFYLGAGVGAVAAAIVPSHDWQTIYRAP